MTTPERQVVTAALEVVVGEWQEFYDVLEPMLDAYRVPPTYVFRGQADASWPLEPSLLRRMRSVTDRGYAHEIEQLLEKEFMAQGALFPEVRSVWPVLLAAPRIERWAFMQHHSCPTRLLDWTASAFVAAYFAVEQFPRKNGALFVVARTHLDNSWKRRTLCKRASRMMILPISTHLIASFSHSQN